MAGASAAPLRDHPLSPGMLHPGVLDVLTELRDRGLRCIVTGGAIRDLLLRRFPSDYDVGVDTDAATLAALYPAHRSRFRPRLEARDEVGIDLLPMGDPPWIPRRAWQAQARSSDPARDFAEAFDYTVNAVQYEPVDDVIVDHVGGLDDVAARRLRAVGDPDRQLARNRVAVVRGALLATRLGLGIAPETRAAMRRCGPAFLTAAIPQRNETLIRLFGSGKAGATLTLLEELGGLDALLPPPIGRTLLGQGRAVLDALDAAPKPGLPISALPTAILWGSGGDPEELRARYPLTMGIWREVHAALTALRGGPVPMSSRVATVVALLGAR